MALHTAGLPYAIMACSGTLTAAVLVAACALAGCSDSSASRAAQHAPTTSDATATTTSTPSDPSPRAVSPTTVSQITVPPTTTAPPAFVGTVSTVTETDLPYTYRPGCPVGPADLRMLHVSYWGFDNQAHVGTIVVNADVVQDVLTVFSTLYGERFPIRQMVPEDAVQGSDPASMASDNTSGFNCRAAIAPGPPQWSAHAYGEAIDVNTVENPYLEGGVVQPAAGAAYLDRSNFRPGMAVPDGQLVAAFAAVGWQWGGRWTDSPDYQHFSKTGA
jgi:hypothetical protein